MNYLLPLFSVETFRSHYTSLVDVKYPEAQLQVVIDLYEFFMRIQFNFLRD